MGVPQLEQCCCGCQLRTGSQVAGWVGAVFGTIYFLFTLMVLLGLSVVEKQGKTDLPPEKIQALRILLIFVVVLTLLKALFSIFLLIGIYKDKLSYYLPWIIYSSVAFVLDVIIFISMIVGDTDVPRTIGTFIGICLNGYFILVVYSDYRQQKEHGRGGH